MTKKYYYSFDKKDFAYAYEFKDKVGFDVSCPNWLARLAEDMASDYCDNHDGWECTAWPYKFYIWNDNEEYIGCVDVHMEYTPSYMGWVVTEE